MIPIEACRSAQAVAVAIPPYQGPTGAVHGLLEPPAAAPSQIPRALAFTVLNVVYSHAFVRLPIQPRPQANPVMPQGAALYHLVINMEMLRKL